MAGLEVKVDIAGASTSGDAGDSTSIPDIPTPKAIGKGFSGAIKASGIGAAIAFIADVVLSFKPLVSVVTNIAKMVSMLLRPISDAVVILLMPILLLMKPIVRAVNQLMRPFIMLAMQFMRDGEIGKATSAILGGLSVVLIKISAELIKLVGGLLITILAEIVGVFSDDAKAKLLDNFLPAFLTLVDDQAAIASAAIVGVTAQLAEVGSEEYDGFIDRSVSAIISAYPNISEQVKTALDTFKTQAIEGDLKNAYKTLTIASVNSIGDFGTRAASALGGAIQAMISALGGSLEDFADSKIANLEDEGLVAAFGVGVTTGILPEGKVKNFIVDSNKMVSDMQRVRSGEAVYFG